MSSTRRSSTLYSDSRRPSIGSEFESNNFESESPEEEFVDSEFRGPSNFKSLPLQIALYYNVFFFPIWLSVEVGALFMKYERLSAYYRIIIICILSCMTIVEVLRIYFGYAGNLLERIPDMAAHLILTVVIQLPQVLFLLTNGATLMLPLEVIVCSMLTVFFALELVFGFLAMRKTIKRVMTRYKIEEIQSPERYSQEATATYDSSAFEVD